MTLLEFMVLPSKEKDRQLKEFQLSVSREFQLAISNGRKSAESVFMFLSRHAMSGNVPSSTRNDDEFTRDAILADPLNKKCRKYSLSG